MAERSRRAGSRRTTPQPVASGNSGPKNSRATRSQSRELSDSQDARATRTAKGREKQGRAVKASKQSKGAPSEPQQVQRDDLSILPEEMDSAENGDQPSLPEGDAGRKSLGGASTFSGTTARTTRSAQELEELTAEGFQVALPDLEFAADKLLKHFVMSEDQDLTTERNIASLFRSLASRGSLAQTNCKRLTAAFDVQRELFSTTSFIEVNSTLKTLFGEKSLSESQDEAWRPDPLLHKANIASLVAAVLAVARGINDAQQWEDIDRSFPQGLFSENSALSNEMRQQTLQLALEIRTRYAIAVMSQDGQKSAANANKTLDAIFKQDDHLKGWNHDAMGPQTFSKFVSKQILQRLNKLKKVYNQRSEGNDVSLEEFPWTGLAQVAMRWAKERLIEIQHSVDPFGGLEHVIEAFASEVNRRKQLHHLSEKGPTSSSEGNAKPMDGAPRDFSPKLDQETRSKNQIQKLSSESFSANSPKSKRVAASLKNYSNRHPTMQATPQDTGQSSNVHAGVQAAPTEAVNRVHGSSRKVIRDSHPPSPSPAAENSNRIYDHAENDWQPQQPDDNEDPARKELSSSQEDQDEDAFQTQTFPRDVVMKAVRSNALQQAESNKENETLPRSSAYRRTPFYDRSHGEKVHFDSQSVENESVASADPNQQWDPQPMDGISALTSPRRKRPSPVADESGQSPPKRFRGPERLSESHDHRSPPPAPLQERPILSQGAVHRQAQTVAKERVAIVPRRPQVRRPWSEEETNRFIELIEACGISYSYIKQMDKGCDGGPELSDRDQVALKDKAQNIKMDFLKSSRTLPRNFEKIPLRSGLIEKLEALGIEYDRVTGRRRDADVRSELRRNRGPRT